MPTESEKIQSNEFKIREVEKDNKRLEDCYQKLDDKIDDILVNHLPHIQRELVTVKVTMVVTTALNIGAVVLSKIL